MFEIYWKMTTELPHNAWFQVRLGWVKLGYPTMQDYFTKILNYFSIDIRYILSHMKKLILFEIYRKPPTELPHNAWFQVRLNKFMLG